MLKYFIATGIYFFIITLFPNQHVIRISGIILILFLIFAKNPLQNQSKENIKNNKKIK